MLKCILFDFGQTLADSAAGFKTAEKWVQEKIKSDLSSHPEDRFLSHYRTLRSEFQRRSDFSRSRLWEKIYEDFGAPLDKETICQWEQEYWRTVRTHTKLFDETIEVLTLLSKSYRLGIITNTQGEPPGTPHRISDWPELRALVEVVIVAGENDLPPKPDPKPFQAALDALQLQPAEAMYVGDDWRIDVEGSRQCGMHPVWLKHESVKRNWPSIDSGTVPVIQNLKALLSPEITNG